MLGGIGCRCRSPGGGNEASGSLIVGNEMQDRHQQQGYRLAEIDQFPDIRVIKDDLRIAQVGQRNPAIALGGEASLSLYASGASRKGSFACGESPR